MKKQIHVILTFMVIILWADAMAQPQYDTSHRDLYSVDKLSRLNSSLYSIGTENVVGEDGNFASFRDAVTFLNGQTEFTGDVVLYFTSDLMEDCTTSGVGLAVDPSPYTITFKPAPEVSPTITFNYPADVNSGPSGAFVIGITHTNNIAWADATPTRNIIFDGSNINNGTTRDLTITNTVGTHRNGMPFLMVGNVADITIKNLNAYHKATNGSLDGGLGFNGAIAFRVNHNAPADNAPHNISIDNCHLSVDFPSVTAGYNGINVFKTGSGSVGYVHNISITNNLIEGKANGLFLAWAGDNILIDGNEIRVNQDIAASVGANAAVQLPLTLAGSNIAVTSNYISKVANLGTNAAANTAAIDIVAGGNYLVANNMITGFEVTGASGYAGNLRGVRINNAAANVMFVYNSMLLNELPNVSGTTGLAYKGIEIVTGNVLMKNNILSAEEDAIAFNLLEMTVLPAEMDHNLYSLASGSNAQLGKYNDVVYADLDAWQLATSMDANSLFADPMFVSATDLKIQDNSPAKAAGTPIAEVAVDMFGTDRDATNPCIGAHENLSLVEVYQVTFVVTDQQDAAIANAVITLEGVANAEGDYVFDNLLEGTYAYSVVAEGYEPASGEVVIIDQNVVEEVVLVAIVIPAFTITFDIADEDGNAITDATVTLNGTANAQGDYMFENLEAGTYAYNIVAPGFEAAAGDVVITDADVTETVTLIAIAIPTYTLTFVLTNEDGIPVTHSIITFNDITNEVGDYVFEGIEYGVYSFSIITEGYFDVTGAIEVNQNLDFPFTLIVDDTSVDLEATAGLLSIYPNPAREVVNVQSEAEMSMLSIADMSGRMVYTRTNLNSREYQINLSQFENGIYIIHVYTDNGVSLHKLQVRK